MMNKISLLIVLSLVISLHSISQDLSVSEGSARTVAEKFYYRHIQSHSSIPADQVKAAGTFIIDENKVRLYYVFNMSTGGFVAVSACYSTPPVLCYSFSGKYEKEGRPDNFQAWMGQYERQIMSAIDTRAGQPEEVAAAWNYYLETPVNSIPPFRGREVLPITTSTWDQGIYYNELCPADPAGPAGHCVTGCVATAMGQLLNYFRWPGSGAGSYSYECPPYGTLSADFAGSEYQWDMMETSLSQSNGEVAEILYHLGVSVDMVYGPDGSGMYNHKAAYSLKTYFKFSPETQYVFRDSTSMDWDSLLVTHLDQQIPMYYAGWSVPDTMGHAFICDGYQGENYYHFNWGWGGAYDGYFYTNNLSPGGSNFNLAQELIIHAVPDTSQYQYPVFCEGEKNISALSGTLDDGSGPLYPYENGAGCSWQITPQDSVNGITLSFLKFSLDTTDFVTVYDGDTTSAPVLGTFTGDDLPGPLSTVGSSMLIVFESDSANENEGFLAEFDAEIPLYCSGIPIYTVQSDTISDGSGTWDYHNNTACLWKITPEGASSVTLYFTEFETEGGFDLLKIFDLQSQQLLAEYSGSYSPGVPDPVTSPSGKMFIAFSTSPYMTDSGWEAYYESNLVNVPEPVTESNVKVFPNPTTGRLTLAWKEPAGIAKDITLADLSGRVVLYDRIQPGPGKQIHFEFGHLLPGIYILCAQSENGSAEYHKIVIQ